MNNIFVTIPAQEFNAALYLDHTHCYLATALKSMGYTDVKVYGLGDTIINGQQYLPKKKFNSPMVRDFFLNNQPINVELVPVVPKVRTIHRVLDPVEADEIDPELLPD